MSLIYLDVETTGLDPDRHGVWEIAYAVEDGPVQSMVVQHSLLGADPHALKLNGYWGSGSGRIDRELSMDWEAELQRTLAGQTLVGANPAFDAAFLRKRWGHAPWHYRLLDVEAFALPALVLRFPVGLAHIAKLLGVRQPNHRAATDVEVLRECHRRLVDLYDKHLHQVEDLFA